jgi:hypothetical protein
MTSINTSTKHVTKAFLHQLTLESICTLSLLPNNVKNSINKLGSLRVVYNQVREYANDQEARYRHIKRKGSELGYRVEENRSLTSFRPVVPRTTLTKDEIVRAEKATKRTRADGIHGTRLKIN